MRMWQERGFRRAIVSSHCLAGSRLLATALEHAMRVTALFPFERGIKTDRYFDILRLRRRVFKERLGWAVTSTSEFEMDEFDTLSPIYLAAHNDEDRIVGCVRFLSCDDATMVQTVFSDLLDGHEIPQDQEIYESSRFCIDTEHAQMSGETGLRVMTHVLFAGMIEWGSAIG